MGRMPLHQADFLTDTDCVITIKKRRIFVQTIQKFLNVWNMQDKYTSHINKINCFALNNRRIDELIFLPVYSIIERDKEY